MDCQISTNYPGIKLVLMVGKKDKIEKLSSCALVVHTTAKDVINFHVAERTRMAVKSTKKKNYHASGAKTAVFLC